MAPIVEGLESAANPPPSERWDGWDGPDYEPTREELERPILGPLPPGTTPENTARALLTCQPPGPVYWPDLDDEDTHPD